MKKRDTAMTELAHCAHIHRLAFMRQDLSAAVRWRTESLTSRSAAGRAMARRHMRINAKAWARHWREL